MRPVARAFGLGSLLPVLAALLVMEGCARPVFSIGERKVCKAVDAAGKPVGESSTFAPSAGRVFVWFRYSNAAGGQTVKVKFTCVDPLGTKSTTEVQKELEPGTHTASAELTGLDGGPLAPGQYTAEITSLADVAFGPPLAFAVK